MKQRDIIIIIGVAIVSGIFSYAISTALFGGENKANLTAAKVEPISDEFPPTDPRYFNSGSLNPTKNITIGDYSQQPQ